MTTYDDSGVIALSPGTPAFQCCTQKYCLITVYKVGGPGDKASINYHSQRAAALIIQIH